MVPLLLQRSKFLFVAFHGIFPALSLSLLSCLVFHKTSGVNLWLVQCVCVCVHLIPKIMPFVQSLWLEVFGEKIV